MQEHFSEDSQKAIRYCVTCPRMCRFACPVAHQEARETVTPWGLMSLVHLVNQGAAPLDQEVADVLARCTGCGQCETACLHNNDIPRAVFEARAMIRDTGKIDVWEPGERGVVHDLPAGAYLGFATQSETAFYATAWQRPDRESTLRRMASIFDAVGESVQLLDLSYAVSEFDLLAGGFEPLYRDRAEQLARRFSAFETVVTDDAGLVAASRREGWSAPWDDHKVTLQHWTEFVAPRLERLGPGPAAPAPTTWRYHDDCQLGRRAGVYDAPRQILAWATGAEPAEFTEHHADSLCCGAGAGYPQAAPEHAAGLARAVLAEQGDNAVVVSASQPCAAHLQRFESDKVVLLDVLLAQTLLPT